MVNNRAGTCRFIFLFSFIAPSLPVTDQCTCMTEIKIFLASSSELVGDRIQFELFINRKNKEWKDHNLFFNLQIWEDFIDMMSHTRLQDEYNKVIQTCDIFVMLFWNKVGKYTEEEFNVAFKQFQETKKPFVFTYFKDDGSGKEKDPSVAAFRKRLNELGHFETVYKNTEHLLLHFSNQLTKLQHTAFKKFVYEAGATIINQQAEKIYNIDHIDNANFS